MTKRAIAFLVATLCILPLVQRAMGDVDEVVTQLTSGFTTTHEPGGSVFQPLLYAQSKVFAFGFLRINNSFLDLAVLHLPSSFPLWRATPARLANWSEPVELAFNGQLILTSPKTGVIWYSQNGLGDIAFLINNSNLQIQRYEKPGYTWQSFDNPSDTLVAYQNFTVASPPLISGNQRFSLQLMKTYMALNMNFHNREVKPMYWKHTALQANPQNSTEGPIYGHVDPLGYFGIYLVDGERVDVLTFATFGNSDTGFRRMTLEDDGNIRAYYWDSNSWVHDFQAISEPCDLPTSCGAYGLCVPGETKCKCITNSTGTPCHAQETSDLCGEEGNYGSFDVIRKTRITMAYKDYLPFEIFETLTSCEQSCQYNCSCWGAIYNNASGYCYQLVYPIETALYQLNDGLAGYFKIRAKNPTKVEKEPAAGAVAGIVVASLIFVGLVIAGIYFGNKVYRKNVGKKRPGERTMEQDLAPGPYKDLKTMVSPTSSFRG